MCAFFTYWALECTAAAAEKVQVDSPLAYVRWSWLAAIQKTHAHTDYHFMAISKCALCALLLFVCARTHKPRSRKCCSRLGLKPVLNLGSGEHDFTHFHTNHSQVGKSRLSFSHWTWLLLYWLQINNYKSDCEITVENAETSNEHINSCFASTETWQVLQCPRQKRSKCVNTFIIIIIIASTICTSFYYIFIP